MPDPVLASPTTEKYLRLHLCRDVGAIRLGNLLEAFGDIDRVLGASVAALKQVRRIGPRVAECIARSRDQVDVSAEVATAERHHVRIVCLEDESYPRALRSIPDPPGCLYYRGGFEAEDTVSLAIVGSRRCSRYGVEQAERFGALLTHTGMTVVSGMARGIDTAAHRGALSGGGRTIAVIGCGLSHLYPPESTDLARTIAENGALVSELPMDVPPDTGNFPPRNRIIAGLSLGVFVIEASRRSGALISARLASEYNREVFALPGRVDTPFAEGCHGLIKSSSAKLVTSLEDILEELGEAGRILMPGSSDPEPAPTACVRLDEDERRIALALERGALSAEAICNVSRLPPSRLAALLTALQLKAVIRRAGPDLYELVAPHRD